jgi:hypothetical protein
MMIKNDGLIPDGFIELQPQGLICFRTLLSQSRKNLTSSASISQTDSVLTGVLGPEYD